MPIQNIDDAEDDVVSKIEPLQHFHRDERAGSRAKVTSSDALEGRVAPVYQRLAVWFERYRSRAALRRLDERMLRDVGLTQEEAQREARKPFWRG